MWTGHLSKFCSGQPPGAKIQRINALLHEEPYSTISRMLYWSFFLLTIPPIVGVVSFFVFIYEMIRFFIWPRGRIEPKNISSTTELAVVITGCDTGFGKELVFRLATEGFVVFAGCLNGESFSQFEGDSRIKPLLMDVTKQSHVDSAYETVKKWLEETEKGKKRHFHALVNNAGVFRMGYIDWSDVSYYHDCMEVNCFGQIRTIKAFLPIFKQQAASKTYANSQIINMASMAGMVAGNGAGLSAYEVSKAAAESFTEGLRLEMKMFGIKVVSVNPSAHHTPLVDKVRKELWGSLSPQIREEYGKDFFEAYEKHAFGLMDTMQWDFKVVVSCMVEAIKSAEPPSQLIVGADARFIILPMRMLPSWYRHFIFQASMPPQIPAMLKPNYKTKDE